MKPAAHTNLLTIVVEDYFHATGLGGTSIRDRWDKLPGRVEYNTRRLLRVLDRHTPAASPRRSQRGRPSINGVGG